MDRWSLAFRVAPDQDKDTRYEEVLSSMVIPGNCVPDLQEAHDTVWDDFATNGEPTKPYAVYLSGTRDGDVMDTNIYIDRDA